MAKLMVGRNIAFAAEMGADTVVLHAGRVAFGAFFDRLDTGRLRELFREGGHCVDGRKYAKALSRAAKRRRTRGEKLLDVFRAELDGLLPALEKHNVTLALENLPYYEGFPLPDELSTVLSWDFGRFVKGWYDTGHARVCEMHGWLSGSGSATPDPSLYAGMHLNDVEAFDDNHFAPGGGKVDFAALKSFAEGVGHVVFEPNSGVGTEELKRGVGHIRRLWDGGSVA